MCPEIVPCNPGNKMEETKYQTISKSNRKIIETEAFSIVLKHLYMIVEWLVQAL